MMTDPLVSKLSYRKKIGTKFRSDMKLVAACIVERQHIYIFRERFWEIVCVLPHILWILFHFDHLSGIVTPLINFH